MIGKTKKPSKQEILRSIQTCRDTDLTVVEPVTLDNLSAVLRELTRIVKSSGMVSVIVVKENDVVR